VYDAEGPGVRRAVPPARRQDGRRVPRIPSERAGEEIVRNGHVVEVDTRWRTARGGTLQVNEVGAAGVTRQGARVPKDVLGDVHVGDGPRLAETAPTIRVDLYALHGAVKKFVIDDVDVLRALGHDHAVGVVVIARRPVRQVHVPDVVEPLPTIARPPDLHPDGTGTADARRGAAACSPGEILEAKWAVARCHIV